MTITSSLGTATGTAAFYTSAVAGMTRLSTQTDTLQNQISTGNRLSAASDDPLAAAQLRTLAAEDTAATADTATAGAAKDSLSLADTTLSQMTTIVTQIRTLATQAASGTLSDSDRSAIGSEVGELRTQLLQLANTTDSTGAPVFGGEASGSAAYTVDASGNASYVGTASAPTASLGNGLSVTAGITGAQAFGFTSGGSATDIFAATKTLADALTTGGSGAATAANAALTTLSDGLTAMSGAQAVVGARLAWVGTAATLQTTYSTDRTADESRIGGTDITAAVSTLQQTMTILQASQASFAKLSSLTLFSALS